MSLLATLLWTTASALWNTAFVCAGYLLGDNWTEVTVLVSAYSKAVLVFVAVRRRPKGARGCIDMRLRRGARPATTVQQPPDNP